MYSMLSYRRWGAWSMMLNGLHTEFHKVLPPLITTARSSLHFFRHVRVVHDQFPPKEIS